jgi:hypothetical protein
MWRSSAQRFASDRFARWLRVKILPISFGIPLWLSIFVPINVPFLSPPRPTGEYRPGQGDLYNYLSNLPFRAAYLFGFAFGKVGVRYRRTGPDHLWLAQLVMAIGLLSG